MDSLHFEVRSVINADIPAIARLDYEQSLYHHRLQPDMIQPVEERLYLEQQTPYLAGLLQNPKRLLLMAETDVTPLGYLSGKLEDSPPIFIGAPQLYVEDLFVLATARGKGIGTALLEAAYSWGRELGALSASLNVNKKNNPARAFYEKAGYCTIELKLRRSL